MRSNLELMSRAWDAYRAQWLSAIGFSTLHGVASSVAGGLGAGVGTFVCSGPLAFGFCRAMVLIHRGHQPGLETYFDGFKRFVPSMVAFLLSPARRGGGIHAPGGSRRAAGLGLVPNLLHSQDHPEMGAEEAARKLAADLGPGQHGKVIGIGLLMVGVLLLGLLALGVRVIIAAPLASLMAAGLYEELRLSDGRGDAFGSPDASEAGLAKHLHQVQSR